MSRIMRTKFLYRAAVNELDSGHPFAAGMAISLLQDAVEAMAHDAAASVNAQLPARASFLDHWEAVAKCPSGKQLPYKIEMRELNAARVAFKHQGVSPAVSEAEKQRLAAHRFLAETAQGFFGLDFDELSEADLIANVDIHSASRSRVCAHCSGSVEIPGVLSSCARLGGKPDESGGGGLGKRPFRPTRSSGISCGGRGFPTMDQAAIHSA